MTAPNLIRGKSNSITLDGKKDTYWTIAQKVTAAPSIVEIDKQPQLKPRNEQFLFEIVECSNSYRQYQFFT